MKRVLTSALLLSPCLMSPALAQDYALSPDGASVVRVEGAASIAASSFTTSLAGYGYTTATDNTGSLSVSAYNAGYGSDSSGGGHFEALYSYGSKLPKDTSLSWIQVITTNVPMSGKTSPYLDIGPTTDCHTPAPFYGCTNENRSTPITASSIDFYDFSMRDSSKFSTVYPINWQAKLYPVLVNGTALTIENGISWGWSMKKAVVGTVTATFANPSPASATVGGVGTNSFSWGIGMPDQSSLTFAGANFDSAPQTPFKLGTITYHNGQISGDSGADSVDFSAMLNFTNISEMNFPLKTTFTLINTPNTDDPVASADYVTLGDYGYTFHVYEGYTATADLYVKLNKTVTASTKQWAQDSAIWPGTIYTNAGYTLTVLGFQDPSSGGFIDAACSPTDSNDVCYINATTDTSLPIDGLGGSNTLQLGGAADFSFDAGLIGTTYSNFDTFIKADASNITLTGAASQRADWNIIAGTLTVSGGQAIADTAEISLADGATFALSDPETIGSLTGLGTVSLAANTLSLTAGGNYGGVIEGTGNIVLTGGTLFLSGANTFSGTTTIGGGTLALSGSGTLAASEGIVDNGTFDISGAFSSVFIKKLSGSGTVTLGAQTLVLTAANGTFAGVISGNGGLAITGGTEILTGANTYTGTTTIVAGTLQIGSGGTAGAIAGQSVVNNGELIFNRSDALTYSGVISGTGALTQAGSGTLVLNGVNTYTGLTTIAAGRLEVGDANHANATLAGSVTVANGATLLGHGTIGGGVINTAGGTVAPGGSIGTLTVGSYTQGAHSTLAVEIAPTGASLLNVIGAATLGGTLSATFDTGAYTPAIIPVVRAASITGTFSTFATTNTMSDWVYGIYYAPTNKEVDIVVSPKSAGQIYGDLVTAGLDDVAALNVIAFDHAAFGNCTSYANNTVSLSAGCGPWVFWAHGFGGTAHTDAGNGAAAFNTHSWGFVGGVDRYFGNGASLNVAAAYNSGSLFVSGSDAKADTDETFISLAVHAPWPLVVLDSDVFYMTGNAAISRASGFGSTIQSTTRNTTFGFSAQISHPLLNGDVVPLVRATYAYLSYGPVIEMGGGGLNLAGMHGHRDMGRYDFGIMLNHAFTTSNGALLQPHLLAAFETVSTGSSSPNVAIRLADSPNTDFIAPSPGPNTSAALVRLGLSAQLSTEWNVDAGVEGWFSSNQQQALFHLDAAYHF